MKPRAKVLLIGALLIFLAALASVKRGARSDGAGRSGGACCPFMPTLDRMLSPSVTNGTTINCNPNAPPTTNLTLSPKQP